MTRLAYDKRVSKVDFMDKLIHDFGFGILTQSPYVEDNMDASTGKMKKSRMTLFYVDGTHVGTWMAGKGWIFASAYNSVTA